MKPREVQHQRAHEPGRGRHATAPWQIPWAGWKDILSRTYQQINEDRVLAVAAGVVFYALLAIFPAITAMVSLYGLFAKVSTINEHFSLVAGFLPGGAVEIVQEQVNRLVSKGDAKLGIGFIFGLAVALWSANAVMKAIMDALNVVYDEKEKRGFIKLNLVSLAFTLAALVTVLLAVGAVVVVPVVLNYIGLGSIGSTLVNVLRWPLLLAVIIVGSAVLYRYGPSRREPRWQWLTVGSGVAAIAWLISSVLLCVLRVSTQVLELGRAVISDENGASDYMRFLHPRQWQLLDFDAIYAMDWRHPGYDDLGVRSTSIP